MRTGHLFAGAGGGLYADLILGHRPQFAVEWERYPCRILRQQFPDVRVYEGDARLFDPSEWAGRVDSIHSGFPCQDISVAGVGSGIDGDRSGLWSEVVRVADAIRPRELFLENSPAITTRGLDRVLSDLAALGFDAEWACIPAAAVGAPHRRDRWWCLARRADSDDTGQCANSGTRESSRSHEEGNDLGWICPTMANAMQREREVGCNSSGMGRQSELGEKRESRVSWWSAESRVGRVADGVANRVNRIKALGNGQVPLQAAAAYRLLEARYDRTQD